MNNNKLIQKARGLCEKATPGPWMAKTNRHPQCNGEPWGWISGAAGNITWSGDSGGKNAAFISASRTLVPQLCDALEKMTARAEKSEAERDTYKAALEALHIPPELLALKAGDHR